MAVSGSPLAAALGRIGTCWHRSSYAHTGIPVDWAAALTASPEYLHLQGCRSPGSGPTGGYASNPCCCRSHTAGSRASSSSSYREAPPEVGGTRPSASLQARCCCWASWPVRTSSSRAAVCQTCRRTRVQVLNISSADASKQCTCRCCVGQQVAVHGSAPAAGGHPGECAVGTERLAATQGSGPDCSSSKCSCHSMSSHPRQLDPARLAD